MLNLDEGLESEQWLNYIPRVRTAVGDDVRALAWRDGLVNVLVVREASKFRRWTRASSHHSVRYEAVIWVLRSVGTPVCYGSRYPLNSKQDGD